MQSTVMFTAQPHNAGSILGHSRFWNLVLEQMEAGSKGVGVVSQDFLIDKWSDEIIQNATELERLTEDGNVAILARDEDNRLFDCSFYRRSSVIYVSIFSPLGIKDAQSQLDALKRRCPEKVESDDNSINVSFWTERPDGMPSYMYRSIDASSWEESQRNYALETRRILDQLHQWVTPPERSGRLLLLHGPPGTGKTNALTSLGLSWKKWCRMDFVVDPERFFGSAYYMTQVLTDDSDSEKWRLIVVEDADELISDDAKVRKGQSVSRLLNVCDGLVGQKLKILILITTNEPLTKLHPAIIRPGRCLANVTIGKLRPIEANEWRLAHGLSTVRDGGQVTLAELYEELRNTQVVSTEEKKPLGFTSR